MNYFLGIDPGAAKQGIAIIDENDAVVLLEDTGKKMPKDLIGNDVPDFLRNTYQLSCLKTAVDSVGASNIKMCIHEGPIYTGSLLMFSVGTIHGFNHSLLLNEKIDFGILTPKSINFGIFGTAKNISKVMTINEMKKRFPSIGGRLTSNQCDALAMAFLAKKLYYLLTSGIELNAGEKEIFLSKAKYNGHPKGLVYNLNNKLFMFDAEGNLLTH